MHETSSVPKPSSSSTSTILLFFQKHLKWQIDLPFVTSWSGQKSQSNSPDWWSAFRWLFCLQVGTASFTLTQADAI